MRGILEFAGRYGVIEIPTGLVTAEKPLQNELALWCPDADLHSGNAAVETTPQVICDFHIGAGSLGGRQQRDAYFSFCTPIGPPG